MAALGKAAGEGVEGGLGVAVGLPAAALVEGDAAEAGNHEGDEAAGGDPGVDASAQRIGLAALVW